MILSRGLNTMLRSYIGPGGSGHPPAMAYIVFGDDATAPSAVHTGIIGNKIGHIALADIPGALTGDPTHTTREWSYVGSLSDDATGVIREMVLHTESTGKGGSLTARTPCCNVRSLVDPPYRHTQGQSADFGWRFTV